MSRLHLRLPFGVMIALSALSASMIWARTISASRPAQSPDTQTVGFEPFEQIGTVGGAAIELARHRGILFTSNGRLFATEHPEGDHVRLWDALTLKPATEWLSHPRLDAFSVTADGRTVFTSGGGEVRLWDVATSKPRTAVKADTKRLSFFDSTRDGRRFLTISSDCRTLTVWNAAAKRPEKAYDDLHTYDLTSAQFDPSGKYLVDKEFNGPFDLLRAETGREVCPEIETQADRLSSSPYQAQFDSAGRRLAVPLPGGIRILDCGTGKALAEAHWDPDIEPREIAFSPDGSLVAVTTFYRNALANGPVFVFDAAAGHHIHQLGTEILSCQITPDARFALCNYADDKDPELFDLQHEVPVERFASMHEMGGSALMSPDGETILVGSGPNTISVWRLRHVDSAVQR